jgi:hypothetical protein
MKADLAIEVVVKVGGLNDKGPRVFSEEFDSLSFCRENPGSATWYPDALRHSRFIWDEREITFYHPDDS